jgi:hypothetical protein
MVGAKEHRIPNDQSAPIKPFRLRLLGQKQPLAHKLLVLFLDWTGVAFREPFAFRRVSMELFGSGLHVTPSM